MAEPILHDVPMQWAGTLPLSEAIERNACAVERVALGGPSEWFAFEPAAAVFTLGRRAQTGEGRQSLAATLHACGQRGLPVLDVDRGGLGTLHLPGQLVVFVAVACSRVQLRGLVGELLRAAGNLARQHGISARVDAEDDVGLWTPHGKLASLGLRWQRGVAGHGMAVNVAIDPTTALGLTLCGRPATRMASLGSPQPAGSAAVAHAAHALDQLLRDATERSA